MCQGGTLAGLGSRTRRALTWPIKETIDAAAVLPRLAGRKMSARVAPRAVTPSTAISIARSAPIPIPPGRSGSACFIA